MTVKNTIQPKDKNELLHIIEDTIQKEGFNCNLNFIDTSLIDDMSKLFYHNPGFNGDISEWNTSNVKNMGGMFFESNFNGDISKWDVSNVRNMGGMFYDSDFNGDISKWNTSNVLDMSFMFASSKFCQDISSWDMSGVLNIFEMFEGCPLEEKLEFKPKI